jgi:hypothetical protein
LKTAEHWKYHYALADPRIDDPIKSVFYIGRASGGKHTPQTRFKKHLAEASSGASNYKCNKIRAIQRAGYQPILIELPDCEGDNELEMSLIASYRANGAPLTNATAGGEGVTDPSPAVRRKISEAVRRANARPETKAKIAATNATVQTKAKRSAASIAYNSQPEVKVKRAKMMAKRHEDPNYREMLRQGNVANWADPDKRNKRIKRMTEAANRPEVKRAQSINIRSRWADSEYKTRMQIAISRTWEDESIRQKRSDGIKTAYKNESLRTRLSETHKRRCLNPDVKNKLSIQNSEINSRPEVKLKHSDVQRRLMSDPVFKAGHALRIRNAFSARRQRNPDYCIALFLWLSKIERVPNQIAKRTGLCPSTIQRWVKKYTLENPDQCVQEELDQEYKQQTSRNRRAALAVPEVKKKRFAAIQDAANRPDIIKQRCASRREKKLRNPNYVISAFLYASNIERNATRLARETNLCCMTVRGWIKEWQQMGF